LRLLHRKEKELFSTSILYMGEGGGRGRGVIYCSFQLLELAFITVKLYFELYIYSCILESYLDVHHAIFTSPIIQLEGIHYPMWNNVSTQTQATSYYTIPSSSRQMTQCHLHLKTRFQHLKTRFHCHSVFIVHKNTPGRIYMMLSLGILVIFK
jgi:hypothetical protein